MRAWALGTLWLALAGCAHGDVQGRGTSLPVLERVAELEAATAPSGRPLIAHFWALWCKPCMEELPATVTLAREAHGRGIDVLFVNLDAPDHRAEVRATLESLDAFGPIRHVQLSRGLRPDEVTNLFDPDWAGTLPATFGLTSSRKVVFGRRGRLVGDDGERLFNALAP